jgi:hypothetical protein
MKMVRGDVVAAAAGLEVILRHVEVALEVIMTVVVVDRVVWRWKRLVRW